MKLIATTALAFALSAGIASASPCKLDGKNWKCPVGGTTYTIANANSAAEAAAFASAHAAQQQGQAQGQNQSSANTNDNDNSSSATNGGNSVNIEGAPKHTTSLSANIGLSVSLPIASGVQGASCRDTVRLAREMGQETLALNVFLECPHVRKLNLKVNPGDKG
jgi:hypothetical protein